MFSSRTGSVQTTALLGQTVIFSPLACACAWNSMPMRSSSGPSRSSCMRECTTPASSLEMSSSDWNSPSMVSIAPEICWTRR